jgi:hypothetical protein
MHRDFDGVERLALGFVGGLAGTMAIQALLGATQKWAPAAMPPMRDEPGHFMVEQAERLLPTRARGQIPAAVESGAGKLLGMGYGLTFGTLYAAVRPRGGSPLADGLLLGLVCWAAGYLGWLPAVGLMPPVWRQKAPQALAPVADHLAYGVATVAAYNWLRGRLLRGF